MRMLIPILRTLSVAVASPALAALRQHAVMPFCVANKPCVVCASLVPGAAVPWNLLSMENGRNAIGIANGTLTLLVK